MQIRDDIFKLFMSLKRAGRLDEKDLAKAAGMKSIPQAVKRMQDSIENGTLGNMREKNAQAIENCIVEAARSVGMQYDEEALMEARSALRNDDLDFDLFEQQTDKVRLATEALMAEAEDKFSTKDSSSLDYDLTGLGETPETPLKVGDRDEPSVDPLALAMYWSRKSEIRDAVQEMPKIKKPKINVMNPTEKPLDREAIYDSMTILELRRFVENVLDSTLEIRVLPKTKPRGESQLDFGFERTKKDLL